MNNFDVAQKYAAAGMKIFPCRLKTRAPCIENWASNSTSDIKTIEAWWRQFPDALVGLPMKPNNLIALDCDRGHGNNIDGIAAFASLVNGQLQPHPIVNTPRGGQHHFFRQRDDEPLGNGRGTLPDGIDVRGTAEGSGGYVIAPGTFLPAGYTYPDGTTLKDGARYRLEKGAPSILSGDIPILPDCLAEKLRKPKQGNGFASAINDVGWRERKYAEAALGNQASEVAATGKGHRNERLNLAALKMGHMIGAGWIGQHAVEGALLDAAIINFLVKEDGRAAVLQTISSGIDAGLKNPHPPLQDRPSNKNNQYADEVTPPI